MADKYQTTIAGFLLDVETISDTIPVSIAKHEYPNTHGARLENMGQKARSITIRCYFGVLGGLATFEDYFEFIKILDSSETLEFVHPDDGLLKGCIENVGRRKNERQQLAEVDITFIEDKFAGGFMSVLEPDVEGSAEEEFLNCQAEQMSSLESAMNAALQVYQGAASYARDFTAQAEELVAGFEARLNEITQPANTLISTITYAATLPARTLGAVTKYMERQSALSAGIKNAPTRFVQSFRDGTARLLASLPTSKKASKQSAINIVADCIRVASVAQLSLDLAGRYKADEQERKGQKKMETGQAFDASGNYLAPVPVEPIMTVQDIEKTLADVRTDLQTAINQDRSMRSLQQMALNLMRHANKIKLDAEKIYTIEVSNETPLHLLCLQYGLPYNYAERILAINPQIKNPSFCKGTVRIYAR